MSKEESKREIIESLVTTVLSSIERVDQIPESERSKYPPSLRKELDGFNLFFFGKTKKKQKMIERLMNDIVPTDDLEPENVRINVNTYHQPRVPDMTDVSIEFKGDSKNTSSISESLIRLDKLLSSWNKKNNQQGFKYDGYQLPRWDDDKEWLQNYLN